MKMLTRAKLMGAVLALSIAFTGLATTTASVAAAVGKPITIGIICSCTGPAGGAFTPIPQAFESWANTVNKSGGIDGHHVQVINDNDQTTPGLAISDAQTLLSDHVVAVVDESLLDSEWLAKFQAANVPVIGNWDSVSSNSDMFVPGETQGTNSSNSYAAELQLAKAAHVTKIAAFTVAQVASTSSGISGLEAAALKAKANVHVVYSASISLTQPSYTAECVAAEQANATGFVPTGAPTNLEMEASDCNQQGYHPIYIVGGAAWSPSMAAAPGLKDNTWIDFGQYPYFVTSQPAIKALDTAMDKYFPGARTAPAAPVGELEQAWAAGVLIQDAFAKAGLSSSTTPTSATLVKGLYSLKGDTAGGLSPPLTFTRGQDHQVNCWFDARFAHGKHILLNGGKASCATAGS